VNTSHAVFMLNRWIIAAIAFYTSFAFAHGPLDHSARLTLMGDTMELGVTLGPDLTQRALQHAGLTATHVSELMASRGPSGHGIVSEAAVAALVSLQADGRALNPARAIVMTDGTEYLFILMFPRPAGQALTMKAKYLEAVETPAGGLEVVQEGAGRLSFEALSHSRTTVDLTLPTQVNTQSDPSIATAPPVESSASNQTDLVAPSQSQLDTSIAAANGSRSAGSWAWWLGGFILAVVLVLSWGRRAKLNLRK
jgi:hypothetical protein